MSGFWLAKALRAAGEGARESPKKMLDSMALTFYVLKVFHLFDHWEEAHRHVEREL